MFIKLTENIDGIPRWFNITNINTISLSSEDKDRACITMDNDIEYLVRESVEEVISEINRCLNPPQRQGLIAQPMGVSLGKGKVN